MFPASTDSVPSFEPAVDPIPLAVTSIVTDGGFAGVLMVNGEVAFTMGTYDTAEEAKEKVVTYLSIGFGQAVKHVQDHLEEGEGGLKAEYLDKFIWTATWVEDIQVGQIVKFGTPDGQAYDYGEITRIECGWAPTNVPEVENVHITATMTSTVFAIYRHPDDVDCPGHHYYGPPRAPGWIGTPKPNPEDFA